MRTAVLSFLSFIFLSFFLLSGLSLGAQNYTHQQANLTISNASAYLSAINQSGYLVFYPNLTQAYNYLARARSLSNRSPSLAENYAQQAESSAASAYSAITSYRYYAFIITAMLTIIVGMMLYLLTKPIPPAGRRK